MTDRDDTGAREPQQGGHVWGRDELMRLNIDQLHKLAAQAHLEGRSRMGKAELLDALTGRRE